MSTFPKHPIEMKSYQNSQKKTITWKPTIGRLLEPPNVSQKLLIMRHAERVDYTFPKWTEQCFVEGIGYERLDMNMPLVLPARKDDKYWYPWRFDSPITNMGTYTMASVEMLDAITFVSFFFQ